MPDDHILSILLRYANDPAALSGAAQGADNLSKSVKSVETQATSATTAMRQLRMEARELNQVATITIAAGTALAGPFIAAAAKYVAATKDNDTASSAWLATLDRINRATNDIGRVAAEAILPTMEQAASLAEKVASFLEQNPGVVDAALKIGATAIAVGTVEKVVAEGIRMYADINLISAAGIQNTAADKMLAAAQLQAGAAGTGGAGGVAAGGGSALNTWLGRGMAVGGSLIGASIINGLWTAGASSAFRGFESLTGVSPNTGGFYGFEKNLQTNYGPAGLGQIGALVGGIGQLVSALTNRAQPGTAGAVYGPPAPPYTDNPAYAGLDASDRARYRNTPGTPIPNSPELNYQLALAKAQPAYDQFAKNSAANLDTLQSQQATTRLDYLKQSEQAEKTYTDNRARQIRDFGEQSVQLEKAYDDSRAKQIRDFGEQAAQAEKAYNDTRLKAIRDFNEQQAQAQKTFDESQAKAADAHNTEMVRMAQDHAAQLEQMQDQHDQTSRDLAAKGDALGFVKEQESYARQVADANQKYQVDVARKNQDYATQQADAKKQYDEQRAQALANFQQSQDDAKKAYDDQRALAQANFQQQLDDAAAAYTDQQNQRQQQFQQTLDDAQTAFDNQQAQAQQNFQTTLQDEQDQYDKREAQLKQAFTDQLNAIDPILTGMTKSVETNMQAASDQFALFLKGVQSQIGGGPGYCGPGYHWDAQLKACVADAPVHYGSAAGGYVGYGMRLLGEQGQEFVMSNPTTSAAEKLVGGPLTQERILASLSRSNSFQVNLGGISVSGGSRSDVLAQLLPLVDQRIADAFDQFGNELGSS